VALVVVWGRLIGKQHGVRGFTLSDRRTFVLSAAVLSVALSAAGPAGAAIPPPGNTLTPEDWPPAVITSGETDGHLSLLLREAIRRCEEHG
jgi:hypothetical protein